MLLRDFLKLFGAALVAKGVITSDQLSQGIDAIVLLSGLGIVITGHYLSIKKMKADQTTLIEAECKNQPP